MKIVTVTGKAFFLSGDDIDTDRIIPARFLKCVTFDGLGEHVFEDDRAQMNGQHPFDKSENKGRNILIAGTNFGCGSSREHAVAALQRFGIQVIIAQSFAAIFRGNATANGLVCVDGLDDAHWYETLIYLIDDGFAGNITVNLDAMTVQYNFDDPSWTAQPFGCKMPSADRDMLINGTWDTTATLLQAGDCIEETASQLQYMQPVAPVSTST
jgi:3-isopropylmalate/(R)-2-methylmalate dehydratase small subunit